MPAAARSKMRRTRVVGSRRSRAPLHNIFNKHMRNNTHLLMQHGMHNMCNALRIGADDVESVLRAFLIHNNTIARAAAIPQGDCKDNNTIPAGTEDQSNLRRSKCKTS